MIDLDRLRAAGLARGIQLLGAMMESVTAAQGVRAAHSPSNVVPMHTPPGAF